MSARVPGAGGREARERKVRLSRGSIRAPIARSGAGSTSRAMRRVRSSRPADTTMWGSGQCPAVTYRDTGSEGRVPCPGWSRGATYHAVHSRGNPGASALMGKTLRITPSHAAEGALLVGVTEVLLPPYETVDEVAALRGVASAGAAEAASAGRGRPRSGGMAVRRDGRMPAFHRVMTRTVPAKTARPGTRRVAGGGAAQDVVRSKRTTGKRRPARTGRCATQQY